MDIYSYFRSASKSLVVSSSSDSDRSSSTSKPPSKSGSRTRRYNKKWEETFPWLESDKFTGCILQIIFKKRVEDLFRGLVGLGLPNHSLTGRRRLRKEITFKSEMHLLSCQLDVEAERARNVGEQQRLQNR